MQWQHRPPSGDGLQTLVASLLLIAMAGALTWLLDHERRWFPVRTVWVEGALDNVEPSAVRNLIYPLVRQGYWHLDWVTLEAAIKRLGWVHRAYLRREWPDRVVVTLVEQTPVARWADGSLVNAYAERFNPHGGGSFNGLPLLAAADGEERDMLELMQAARRRLAPQGLVLTELRKNPRGAMTLGIAGELQVRLPAAAPWVALDRFLAVLPKLRPVTVADIGQVDLRYAHGFTVRWKPSGSTSASPVDYPSLD